MSVFTDEEIEYLNSQILGRLATGSPDGRTQRALFGRFAPSEIHDRGTLLPFSDSLSGR